jgi:hypothetical protein
VNNAQFRHLLEGECLFLGASGAQRGGGDWEINFQFAGSQNIGPNPGLKVGDITGIAKWGWEHLWARYVDVVDEETNTLVKRATAAYVEQVYFPGNFAALGIGV